MCQAAPRATVEAIAPILLHNPRGLLMYRDELAGWIGDMDRYSKSKGGDVTPRDVTRNLRAYPTTDDAKQALDRLVDANVGKWTYPGTTPKGGNVAIRFVFTR